MKVASVFMGMPVGGAEDLSVGLARALRARGIKTSFVCLREQGVVGGELAASAEEGKDFHLLKVAPGKRFSWKGLFSLSLWFRKNGFDAVHSHTYHAHTYAVLAAKLAGLPSVLHHHKTLEKMKWHRGWMMRWMTAQAGAVVALSGQTAADLTRVFRLEPAKVHALPNAVDSSVFFPASSEEKRLARNGLGLSSDGFLAGSVASLNEVKNHRATVEAFAASGLGKAGGTALILGEGRERASLEKLARDRGVENALRFAGNQRPVAPWLRSLDAFAMPSYWEGQSLALLQALACNLPILASDIEGNTAVLTKKHPGLFAPDDHEGYSVLLKRVAGDENFRAGLLEFQAGLTIPRWEDLTGQMESVYRKITKA